MDSLRVKIKKIKGNPTAFYDACLSAVLGDIHFFELMKKNSVTFGADTKIMKYAAYGGHVDMCKFLKDEFGLELSDTALEIAAHRGNLDVVKMFREEYPEEWNEREGSNSLGWAIYFGHDEMMDWILTTEFTPLYLPIRCAKNMETLKMLRKRGFQWDETTMVRWAKDGRLDFIKYAHREGCKWDVSMSDAALQHKQQKTYEWMRDNGCPCRPPSLCSQIKNFLFYRV